MSKFCQDRQLNKGSVSDSVKRWVELSFKDVDPQTFIGLSYKASLNQGNNNLTLKGWPLTQGLDQLRSGLLQQQRSFIQSPPPYHQLPMLTPQQQQVLLQAQQGLNSPSSNDVDSRRMGMLLNSRNMGLSKEGQSSSVGDIIPNAGSPMQAPCPVMPRGDTDLLLINKIAQLQQQQQQQQNSNQQQHQLQQQHHNSNQQQQQLQQHALLSQSQGSNHHLHQQDKVGGVGSVTLDGSMSNSFRGNDQTLKNPTGRKRKQPESSSGPANSSGTANTAGPSPNSAPSSPSTHMPGDVISMSPGANSSKALIMYGTDGTGSLASPSNQLADLVEDGSLDDNVESFLRDDTDARDHVGRGFTFTEVGFFRASTSKVVCCHFSSDGKLLASGGHDKKAVLWHTDSFKPKTTLEEHSLLITDVRFSPSMPRLATSSFDKTVRFWDADNRMLLLLQVVRLLMVPSFCEFNTEDDQIRVLQLFGFHERE